MVPLELKSVIDEEHPADVLFYASHSADVGPPKAPFRARFVNFDGAVASNAQATWAKHRPTSTATDGTWSGFYLVSDLRSLAPPILIASLKKRDNKGKFSKTFVPLGPVIIDSPF